MLVILIALFIPRLTYLVTKASFLKTGTDGMWDEDEGSMRMSGSSIALKDK